MKSRFSNGAASPIWRWLFLFLMAGHALVILTAPTPPVLQDYPDWVYQGVLFAKVLARHPAPNYALHHYPVPNSLTTIGIGLLTLAVGWQVAAKLWIALLLASLSCAAMLLLGRLRENSLAVLPVLACGVFLGLDFWTGNINFELSLALLLLLVAHLLRPFASPAVTAILLLLCFFTHMLACATALLVLTALGVQRRNWRCLLPALPTLACVAWYLLAHDPAAVYGPPVSHVLPGLLAVAGVLLWLWRVTQPAPAPQASVRTLAVVALPTALAGKMGFFLSAFGPLMMLTVGETDHHILWRPQLFVFFAYMGLLTSVLAVALLMRAWRRVAHADADHLFLVAASVALALLFLLMPPDAVGITGIDVRFLHLSLALGLFLLRAPSAPWLTTLGTLSFLVCCINLYQFSQFQFQPATVSLPDTASLPVGAVSVAPGFRLHFYTDLQHGRFSDGIFPTAMFHELKRGS